MTDHDMLVIVHATIIIYRFTLGFRVCRRWGLGLGKETMK